VRVRGGSGSAVCGCQLALASHPLTDADKDLGFMV